MGAICALASLAILASPAAALEFFDDRLAIHGFYGMQVRSIMEDFNTDSPIEIECVERVSSEEAPADRCVHWTDTGTWQLSPMAPYETLTVVAIVDISPQAQLRNREIGLKLLSEHGSGADGDADETPSWDDLDSNELVIDIRLRAPNLVLTSVRLGDQTSADVGEMIPVTVVIENLGNVHATDIEVIICEEQSPSSIRKDGCDEENVAARQVIGALMPPNAAGSSSPAEIVLLYPVTAGSHDVVVVIDPDNLIVESSESDNMEELTESLSSSNPLLDRAAQVVSSTWLPVTMLGMLGALGGVLYTVAKGRRSEAKDLAAAQGVLAGSSLE